MLGWRSRRPTGSVHRLRVPSKRRAPTRTATRLSSSFARRVSAWSSIAIGNRGCLGGPRVHPAPRSLRPKKPPAHHPLVPSSVLCAPVRTPLDPRCYPSVCRRDGLRRSVDKLIPPQSLARKGPAARIHQQRVTAHWYLPGAVPIVPEQDRTSDTRTPCSTETQERALSSDAAASTRPPLK